MALRARVGDRNFQRMISQHDLRKNYELEIRDLLLLK